MDTALMGAAIEATVHIGQLRRYMGMFRCRSVRDASSVAHQRTSLVKCYLRMGRDSTTNTLPRRQTGRGIIVVYSIVSHAPSWYSI